MATVIESLKADEWAKHGKYCSGKADQISTILEHFEKTLTPELKEWLYNTRTVAREEATVSFQNALDIYQDKGEKS
jgi:hypothetical protein